MAIEEKFWLLLVYQINHLLIFGQYRAIIWRFFLSVENFYACIRTKQNILCTKNHWGFKIWLGLPHFQLYMGKSWLKTLNMTKLTVIEYWVFWHFLFWCWYEQECHWFCRIDNLLLLQLQSNFRQLRDYCSLQLKKVSKNDILVIFKFRIWSTRRNPEIYRYKSVCILCNLCSWHQPLVR